MRALRTSASPNTPLTRDLLKHGSETTDARFP
jgi:hypothetical protein